MNWDQYLAQLSEFLSKDTIQSCHSELWSCFIHGETIRTAVWLAKSYGFPTVDEEVAA